MLKSSAFHAGADHALGSGWHIPPVCGQQGAAGVQSVLARRRGCFCLPLARATAASASLRTFMVASTVLLRRAYLKKLGTATAAMMPMMAGAEVMVLASGSWYWLTSLLP